VILGRKAYQSSTMLLTLGKKMSLVWMTFPLFNRTEEDLRYPGSKTNFVRPVLKTIVFMMGLTLKRQHLGSNITRFNGDGDQEYIGPGRNVHGKWRGSLIALSNRSKQNMKPNSI
jgi:hypothetical protein